MAKQPKIVFPDWLTTVEGALAGNILVGNYLLDQIGVAPTKLKYAEWGQLWDAMFEFRKVVPNLTPREFHRIASNDYEPPKAAIHEYERLSNVLDNLFSLYAEVQDGKTR